MLERTSEDEKSTAKGKYFLKAMNAAGLVVANGVREKAVVTCPNRLGGSVIDLICVSGEMWADWGELKVQEDEGEWGETTGW